MNVPATVLMTPRIFCLSMLAENKGMARKVRSTTFVALIASWYPGFGASSIPFTLNKLRAKAKKAEAKTSGRKNFNRVLSWKYPLKSLRQMKPKNMRLTMYIQRQISGGENPSRVAFFIPKTVRV